MMETIYKLAEENVTIALKSQFVTHFRVSVSRHSIIMLNLK